MDHVFFHADVDGIICAAIYMNQTQLINTDHYILHPLLSTSRGERFRKLVKSISSEGNFIYVFDYQYIDKADLWIDHHPSDIMGRDPIINPNICFDPRSKSAVSLVCKYLEEMKGIIPTNSENLKTLSDAADMIDCANYPNIDFIFKDKSLPMVLRAYLESAFPSEMTFCRIVEVLAKYDLDLEKALRILNIKESCIDEIADRAAKIKDRLEIYGLLSLVRQKYPYQYPRYSENFVSNVKYNIRISCGDKTIYYVQLAYNKWFGVSNSINIGRYIAKSKYFSKGGGHFNVGSGIMKRKDLDPFLDDFSSFIEKEAGMEKYGVDKKKDKFEKKAQDMVKTGAAKNIGDAREKVDLEKKEQTKDEK